MPDLLKPEAPAKEVLGFPSLALFDVALFVSSSPRPHSHPAQRRLLAVRCRGGCGGEGQGEGAESSAVPPPLPNPLPHPLAVKIVSFERPLSRQVDGGEGTNSAKRATSKLAIQASMSEAPTIWKSRSTTGWMK